MKFSCVLGTVLLVGCVTNIYNTEPEQAAHLEKGLPIVEEQQPLAPSIKTDHVEKRPVDVAPLISNYLAAKLSEIEGRIADAAFFYDRAEISDPQNKELKERAFSLQLTLGNMEESIRLAKSMITKKDPAPISYILLGADALKNDDLESAKRFFKQARAISPMLIQFHVIDAYIDLEQGKNIETIVKNIKKLPPMEGLTAVRHFHLGRLYEKAENYDLAAREYEFSLETDPASSFTVGALERLYHKTDQQDKIKYAYDAFMKKNPDNVMLHVSQQNLENGVPYDIKEPNLKQDIAGVVFELSTLMSSQKLQLAAAQLIHTALLLDETNDFFIFYKAMLEEQNGAIDSATKTYSNIPKDKNTWLGGQIRIADIYKNLGESQKAITLIEALRKDYKQPVLSRILAEMYYAKEDFKKAIELYDTILETVTTQNSVQNFWMYFARGSAYERLAEYGKAEEDLKKSLALQPNNPTALNYLGYMWIDRDQHIDEAYNLIGRALLMRPNDAAILDSMGWVLYKKNEFEKSATYLEKAAEKRPNDATINMHLGDVYEKLERYEEAHLHWSRALLLSPESAEDVQHLKNKLHKVSIKLKK